ncbi:MAG: SRPBCC family protein [Pseudonocardiales bacterium]|nr:SRPBCC family protein [Pseudonocardiales bacterium]
MQLSELPALEVCRSVSAPPEKVWTLVSDITRVGDWGGECVHAEWIDGADGPAVGARFRGHQVRQGREWTSVSVVIEAQPGVSFAWAVGDPQYASATWRYQLAADGSGGTILRYRAVMGPGPSGLSDAIAKAPEREDSIIAFRLNEHEQNMTATLEAIKQAAEQGQLSVSVRAENRPSVK